MAYQEYDRDGGEIRNEVFLAPNDKAAVLVASPQICFGCGRFDPEDFDDEEKEQIRNMSVEDLATEINSCDGGDFLFSLRNETDGYTIFEEGYGMEDDTDCDEWEEDMFEGFLSEED